MDVLLVFDAEADDAVENGCFEQVCFELVGAAEKDGVAVGVAGPEVVDRLRKAANGGRHEGLRVWIAIADRVMNVADMAAEVLMVMAGCRVDENDVVHDWFGEPVIEKEEVL